MEKHHRRCGEWVGVEHAHGIGRCLMETSLIVRLERLHYWLSLLLKRRLGIYGNGFAVRQDYGSMRYSCQAFPKPAHMAYLSIALAMYQSTPSSAS